MKNLTNKLIYILLGVIIFLAEFYIIEYYYDMYQTKKQSKLLDDLELGENTVLNNEIAKENESNSSNVTNDDNSTKETEKMLKLQELQKVNNDIVAWIEIPGTNINYPVLQGNDNDFYMNHNYKKGYSQSGSIFLDQDCSLIPQSSNLLIYGHNMKNGTMFKDLLKYDNKKYFQEHSTIEFTTNYDDSTYEIISAFKSRVYYNYEKNVFRYYYFINASSQDEFDEFVNNAKESSLYDTGRIATFR